MAVESKPTAATVNVQVTATEPEIEVTTEPVAPNEATTSANEEPQEGEIQGDEDAAGDAEFEGEFDPERAKNTIKKFREREKLREKKEKEMAKKLGEVATQLKNANTKLMSFEEQQAAKQMQFEELAVERGSKIQELEQNLAQAKTELEGKLQETTVKTETLTAEVHKLVDDEVRSWPEKVRALVPKRTEASAEDRLERMRAARGVAIDLMNATAEPVPGNFPTPTGGNQQGRPQEAARPRSNRMYEVI